MKYIKHFFLILSLFAVLSCGDGKYSAGDSDLACYSSKSDIYSPAVYTADSYSGGASRAPAAQSDIKFFNDNGTEIPEFQVSVNDGNYITLPDIRVRHCFLTDDSKSGKILTGWNDGSGSYPPGSSYKVVGSANFTAVWEEGVEIYSEAEFYDNISDNLSGTYKLMRHIDLANIQSGTAALSYRPYQAGAEWIPIGNENEPFTGKLYGNGNRIDNLTIDNGTAGVAGLFGAIGGSAEIYDLKINLAADGIKLTAADKDKAAGALAGYIIYDNTSDIIIKNVSVTGGVGIGLTNNSCNSANIKYLYVGGLVGRAIPSSTSFLADETAQITLDNLSNSTPLSAEHLRTGSLKPYCAASLGGIIGEINSDISHSLQVSIANSENTANITLPKSFKETFLGGIIGETNLTGGEAHLTSVKNSGNISLREELTNNYVLSDNASAGGLIGKGDNITVTESLNEGEVTISPRTFFPSSGGVAARIYSGLVKDSVNNGKVTTVNAISAISGVTPTPTTHLSYAGGIVGYMELTSIDNCSNDTPDNISAKSNFGSTFAGGIVGNMEKDSSVSKSFNYDNVTSVLSGSGDRTAYSGGIAGGVVFLYNGRSASIENCSNTGAVEAVAPAAYSGGTVGIVGSQYVTKIKVTINHNFNSGAVKADASASGSGGIAGYVLFANAITSTIDNNSNIGDVEATSSSSDANAGGIIGKIYAQATGEATVAIADNYNGGNVKADTAGLLSYSGGIVGYSLVNSNNNSTSTSIINCYNVGDVVSLIGENSSSKSYSGGIAGYIVSEARANSSIANCYNVGNVKSKINSYNYSNSYSGGIAGSIVSNSNSSSSIANCYNVGNVKSEAPASLSYSYSGGIAGYLDGPKNSVSFCAAINDNVTAIAAAPSYKHLGRIIGSLSSPSSTVSDNIAKVPMEPLPSGSFEYEGPPYFTTKNPGELKSQSTYDTSSGGLDWDFTPNTGVWAWDDGNERPILQWQLGEE
jgi:hypothetical protein